MAHNSKLNSTVSKISNHKVQSDEHDQEVVNIIYLLPIGAFSDGVDSSAFKLDSELLGKFIGQELGAFISNISNEFDFGF